jgi:hypothetical protein
MDQTPSSTFSANTLHCALELSKNSWLLAIQFPDREQPSLYSIEGGNTEKLMAKLIAGRDCWAKTSGVLHGGVARQPFLPDPRDLIGVPAYSSKVARYAVVGIVAPHHRDQMGAPLPAARIVHRYTFASETLP